MMLDACGEFSCCLASFPEEVSLQLFSWLSRLFLDLCPPFGPREHRFICHANDRQFCGVPASRMCDGVIDCDSGNDESEGLCDGKFVEIN